MKVLLQAVQKEKNNTYALLIKMRKIYAVMFLMGNFFCRELLAFEADAEHQSLEKTDKMPTQLEKQKPK